MSGIENKIEIPEKFGIKGIDNNKEEVNKVYLKWYIHNHELEFKIVGENGDELKSDQKDEINDFKNTELKKLINEIPEEEKRQMKAKVDNKCYPTELDKWRKKRFGRTLPNCIGREMKKREINYLKTELRNANTAAQQRKQDLERERLRGEQRKKGMNDARQFAREQVAAEKAKILAAAAASDANNRVLEFENDSNDECKKIGKEWQTINNEKNLNKANTWMIFNGAMINECLGEDIDEYEGPKGSITEEKLKNDHDFAVKGGKRKKRKRKTKRKRKRKRKTKRKKRRRKTKKSNKRRRKRKTRK